MFKSQSDCYNSCRESACLMVMAMQSSDVWQQIALSSKHNPGETQAVPCVHRTPDCYTQEQHTPNPFVYRSLTRKARRFPPQYRGHPVGREAVSRVSQHMCAFGNISHAKFLVCSSSSIFLTSGMQNTVIVRNVPFWFKWMHLFPNGRP